MGRGRYLPHRGWHQAHWALRMTDAANATGAVGDVATTVRRPLSRQNRATRIKISESA